MTSGDARRSFWSRHNNAGDTKGNFWILGSAWIILECILDAKTFAETLQAYTPNVEICLLYDQELQKFRNKKQKA